jgi:UDP-N-acetylmuramate--alanine ligase
VTVGEGVPGSAFSLTGDLVTEAVVALPGDHNVKNAAMSLVAAELLGVPLGDAARALAGFRGVRRRFEMRGEARGAVLVDDYAHLPGEVTAVLQAARSGPWDRVVCVFQPHRYSRTEAHWAEFATAFGEADLLAVTDIYPAGETPRPGISGKLIVDAVLEVDPWRHLAYLPALDDVVRWLEATLRPGDLCLTLGAGDLTTVPDRLREAEGT